VLIAAGVVVAGGAVVALLSRNRQAPALATAAARTARLGPRSVAVVPFENSSADKDNEYFADGVTDELISALARVRGLRVTSRSTSFAFKGSRLGARAIGDSLGVQMILEGSVRKAGNQLRIVTQLTRATDDSAIWSETYNRESRDVFKVQEELAQSILAELQKRHGGAEGASGTEVVPVQLVRHTTKDRDAYDLYLRGRYFWNRRTAEGFQRGAEYFDQPSRDSTFAAAGGRRIHMYSRKLRVPPRARGLSKAADAARRALALDSTLAESHASLGFVNLFYYWDFDGRTRAEEGHRARFHLRERVSLAEPPRVGAGDTASAISYARKATELEPLSLILNTRLAVALWRAGRLDDAERQIRYTMELDPSFSDVAVRALLLLDRGRLDEGVAEMERVGRRDWTAYAYARAGRREEAIRPRASSRQWFVEANGNTRFTSPHLHCAGNADSAFAWLSARMLPETDIISSPRILTRPLRDDPRLIALARRIGSRGDRRRACLCFERWRAISWR
jgi:TolB-like protein